MTNGNALIRQLSITLIPIANGGWLVEQPNQFAPPGDSKRSNAFGAFTTTEDMLLALQNQLIEEPPEPIKLITEEPDVPNDDWHPIRNAPRDRYIRIQSEDGRRHRPMKFTEPCWWDAPDGQLRLADPTTSAAYKDAQGITEAVAYKLLNHDENAMWNANKFGPVAPAAAPVPWGR